MRMKKLLLTFSLLAIVAVAHAVTATIYVKADEAPYLYGWYDKIEINGAWPGKLMTEKVTKKNLKGEDVEFWYKKFEISGASSFNIIFNNGQEGTLKKQTGNISNIASDRYFTYDGADKYTDITEEFGVDIPDVDIQSVSLLSDLNKWDATVDVFTEVTHNSKYTFTLDLSSIDLEEIEYFFRFKLMINNSAYLGYDSEGLTYDAPAGWIEEDTGMGGGSNFGLNLEVAEATKFLFTVTFAGGKDIYSGWTLKIEKAGSTGITPVVAPDDATAPRYDLSGRRVNESYRGVVIQNGRKVVK